MFFCVRGWYCFLLLTSFHSFKTFELYKFIFISCSHVYWCINDWWLRQVWWFQWTRILSFYRRWEKQDKLLPVLILNWSTHTLQKHDKNDHLTLSKKIEDGVDHTIVTCVASQLTSLATRDAGQRRVRPSVSRYIPRYVCNAMCRHTNDVVVRTFNLFLYFTFYPHNKWMKFHKSNICLIEVL